MKILNLALKVDIALPEWNK